MDIDDLNIETAKASLAEAKKELEVVGKDFAAKESRVNFLEKELRQYKAKVLVAALNSNPKLLEVLVPDFSCTNKNGCGSDSCTRCILTDSIKYEEFDFNFEFVARLK